MAKVYEVVHIGKSTAVGEIDIINLAIHHRQNAYRPAYIEVLGTQTSFDSIMARLSLGQQFSVRLTEGNKVYMIEPEKMSFRKAMLKLPHTGGKIHGIFAHPAFFSEPLENFDYRYFLNTGDAVNNRLRVWSWLREFVPIYVAQNWMSELFKAAVQPEWKLMDFLMTFGFQKSGKTQPAFGVRKDAEMWQNLIQKSLADQKISLKGEE